MISDSSYREVTDIEDYNQLGVKIVYQFPYNDYEHSAISTNDTAYVISKWGKYGKYKHYKHECEYYYSSEDDSPDTTIYAEYRYFLLNPKMTGSTSILCDNVQRTFSTDITDMTGLLYLGKKALILIQLAVGQGNQHLLCRARKIQMGKAI